MPVDKSKYVVLDVETNGLRNNDDILSISIYKPDDGTSFNKYLPLELSKQLNPSATAVNGITKKDLAGATPLTQQDVYDLIHKFELDKRIILTYGEFDKRMLKHYFIRKGLSGFDKLNFYNFKHDIISSRFSEGNVTKDNLCAVYKIKNIQRIHSSLNDCVLEWQLFEKMDGKKLFITDNNVFEFNHDYIIPISFFSSHPNLKRHVPNFPNVQIETHLLKRFELQGKGISRFETNANGLLIEHLINTMLKVKTQDSRPFLLANKSRLRFLGTLPSKRIVIPLYFKEDGTVKEVDPKDKEKAAKFNMSILNLKPQLFPIIEYIAHEIFEDKSIKSQELIINKEDNILALCDLSTENAVLEIKTSHKTDPRQYKNQLFYEANGRKCYLLQIDWSGLPNTFALEILEAQLSLGEYPQKGRHISNVDAVQTRICGRNNDSAHHAAPKTLEVPKQKNAIYEQQATNHDLPNGLKYPLHVLKEAHNQKNKKSNEEILNYQAASYVAILSQKSNGHITAQNYTGKKNMVIAECIFCGYHWEARADQLLKKPFCPSCRIK